jgi:CRP-like cAMP-binding protein
MSAAQNHLLELLPARDRSRLEDVCETVQLEFGEVLCQPGTPTRHLYFPVDGFISLVTQVDDHPGLEVGMVGREGMVGSQVVLGVDTSSQRALVQGAGASLRIGVAPFRRELARSVALQRLLDRYVFVMMTQTVGSAGCLRFHQIGPRLARWLLMSQDRAHRDSFQVTHEFLALMLGVRRVGVTEAAGDLQRQGLISYHRGALVVLDRPGLEAAACSCYNSDVHIYHQHVDAFSPGVAERHGGLAHRSTRPATVVFET